MCTTCPVQTKSPLGSSASFSGVELDADWLVASVPLSGCHAPNSPVGSGTARPTANAGSAVVLRPSSRLSALLAVADSKPLTQRRGNQSQPRRTGSRALTTALSGLHASRWGLYRTHNGNNNVKLISYFGKQALLCAMDGENETEKRLLPDLSATDQASSGGDSNGPGPWEPLSSHV